jgi:F0F1-type ATP synthase membrane subunit b/b'
MNEKSVLDYLLTQGPTIVFMTLVNYFQYSYFTKALNKKDEIIKAKDDEIKAMHKETVDMIQRHLEATNRSNEVMSGLKGLLEIIRTDIKDKR